MRRPACCGRCFVAKIVEDVVTHVVVKGRCEKNQDRRKPGSLHWLARKSVQAAQEAT